MASQVLNNEIEKLMRWFYMVSTSYAICYTSVCLFTVGGARQHFFTNRVAVFKVSLDTTFDLSSCPSDIFKQNYSLGCGLNTTIKIIRGTKPLF